MNANQPLQPVILRWSGNNAAAMAAVTLATATGLPLWLLSLCGLLSFSLLLYRCRRRWTPAGSRFGPANAVTLLRLLGMFVLPWLAPGQILYLGLILFAMDGVDGWLARRTRLAGEFGEFFDKESDAFLMLMLCLLLYRLPGGFGPWILLPGLLRYLFVLLIQFAKPPALKEVRSTRGRWIFFFMMLTLLLCFAGYPGYLDLCRPPALLMTLVLVYSFAESLYWMVCTPSGRGET